MSSVWKVGGTAGIAGYAEVDDSGVMTASGGFSGNTTGTVTTSDIIRTTTAPQTIDMADAAVELVWGIAAGAGQVVVTSSRLIVDPASGGASEDLTINTTAMGVWFFILNDGGEGIVLKSNGGDTLVTIPAGRSAFYAGGLAGLFAAS